MCRLGQSRLSTDPSGKIPTVNLPPFPASAPGTCMQGWGIPLIDALEALLRERTFRNWYFENVIVSNFWLRLCIYLTFDLPECIRCLVRVWMWGRRQQRGCQSSCRWRDVECTTCLPTTSPGCSWTMTDGQTHVSLEKRLVIFVALVLWLPPCSIYVCVGWL